MGYRGDMALTLPQELLLLALDDESGKKAFAVGGSLPYGLVGAVLFELALDGTISLGEKRITVRRTRPVGDDVVDPILAWLAAKPRTPSRTISSRASGITRRVSEQLVTARILRRAETNVIGIIPVRRYPALDTRPERDIRSRLGQAVRERGQPDERTAALCALVHATSLTKLAFPDRDPKQINTRFGEIAGGTWPDPGVRDYAMRLRKLVRRAQSTNS